MPDFCIFCWNFRFRAAVFSGLVCSVACWPWPKSLAGTLKAHTSMDSWLYFSMVFWVGQSPEPFEVFFFQWAENPSSHLEVHPGRFVRN